VRTEINFSDNPGCASVGGRVTFTDILVDFVPPPDATVTLVCMDCDGRTQCWSSGSPFLVYHREGCDLPPDYIFGWLAERFQNCLQNIYVVAYTPTGTIQTTPCSVTTP
jgi:hypothetical protein